MKKHRRGDASEIHGRDGGEPRERGSLVLILLCSIKLSLFEGRKARNKASTPPHRTENRYTENLVILNKKNLADLGLNYLYGWMEKMLNLRKVLQESFSRPHSPTLL
jgi:hypothetical protein